MFIKWTFCFSPIFSIISIDFSVQLLLVKFNVCSDSFFVKTLKSISNPVSVILFLVSFSISTLEFEFSSHSQNCIKSQSFKSNIRLMRKYFSWISLFSHNFPLYWVIILFFPKHENHYFYFFLNQFEQIKKILIFPYFKFYK